MCGAPPWTSEGATTEKPASAGGQRGTAISVRRAITRAGSIATAHTPRTTTAMAATAASHRRVLAAFIARDCSADHEGRHAAAAGTHVDDRAARGAGDRAHVRAGDVEGVDVDLQRR